MKITTAFEKLNFESLKATSKRNEIGCPFYSKHSGPISDTTFREINEFLCSRLCGALFPRGYKSAHCPCWHMSNSYVKRKFWKILKESRLGV